MKRSVFFPFLLLLFSACTSSKTELAPEPFEGLPNAKIVRWINATDVRWMRVDISCECYYEYGGAPVITARFNKSDDFVFDYMLTLRNMTDPGGPGSNRIYHIESEPTIRDSGIQEILEENAQQIRVRTNEFGIGGRGHPNVVLNYLMASPTGQDVQIDFKVRSNRSDLQIDHQGGRDLLWLTPADFKRQAVNGTVYEHTLNVATTAWFSMFPEIDPRDQGYGVEPKYEIRGEGRFWSFERANECCYSSPQLETDTVFPHAHFGPGNYTIRLEFLSTSENAPRTFPYAVALPMNLDPAKR